LALFHWQDTHVQESEDMIRKLIGPLVIGVAGAAILIALGVWQVQRLAWKEGVLADIEARIGAAPTAIPTMPDPEADRYLPVVATGWIGPDYVRVLVSQRGIGAGYRIISPFDLGDRIVLVDRGIMPVAETDVPVLNGAVTVRGNLHWPQEVDGFTPENDLDDNLWFAREVTELAAHFGTEPVLVIARDLSETDAPVTPLPVDTSGIPNDHLNYAITWFSLAVVWLGMTAFLVWRITRRPMVRTGA
jgi:surfeit locus 1 family protein